MKKIISVIFILLLLPGTAFPAYRGPIEEGYKIVESEYFPEVKKLIRGAKKSIYVSIYLVTYHEDYPNTLPNQLLRELVKAKERGVEVKVVLDQGMEYVSSRRSSNHPAYFFLKDAGAVADYDIPSRKLHEKLLIIDERIIVIGSHNWSMSAFKRNREASVVLKCPELAREFIEWIECAQLAPLRIMSPKSKASGLYVPYGFLTDSRLGIKLSDNRMKFYLYLLGKWQENGYKTVFLDYKDAAVFIGADKHPRKEYRTYINKLLRLFNKEYKLVSFSVEFNKPAVIELLDYKDPDKLLKPDLMPGGNCFKIPGAFFEFGWVQRLSVNAKYVYFTNLLETDLSTDPGGIWSHSRRYLRKRYHITAYMLTQGVMELRRYHILSVKYGPLEYPFTKNLKAPQYRLLPLYSWDWLQEEMENLKQFYGKEKVEKARQWAEVLQEENNLSVIEKLISYSDKYGEKSVIYAVEKVAEKRIGNPKRSFIYMEGIILEEARRKQEGEQES